MRKTIVSLAFVVASSLAWALPSLQQVESEVQQGHTAQAESMMSEVVAAKPDSAKAHYVYAELLARNGKFSSAADEAKKARQIDPDIKFTQPDKFRAFEQLLEREQRPAVRAQQAPAQMPQMAPAATTSQRSGVPGWIWIVGLAAIGFFLWRGFSRSRGAGPMAAAGGMPGAYGGTSYPPGGPMPMSPYGPGTPAAAPGGGLLKTGLAVAGGVAGGMLIDEMLHRRNDGGNGLGGNFAGGGYDPGQSNNAATELETRQVDFGTGNDWDAGGGGSFDTGGGSDGGGGWD